AVCDDGDQAFGGKMAQSFAHRNSADLKLCRDGILSKLLAFAKLTAENFVTQALKNRGGQGLPGNGRGFFRRNSLCAISQAVLTLACYCSQRFRPDVPRKQSVNYVVRYSRL